MSTVNPNNDTNLSWEIVGRNLRQLRALYNLSQEQVGTLLHVCDATISRCESGKPMRFSFMLALLQLFECTYEQITSAEGAWTFKASLSRKLKTALKKEMSR